MKVRELIGHLQQMDPEHTVLMLTGGGAIYDDIDSELVALPNSRSIAINPRYRVARSTGRMRHRQDRENSFAVVELRRGK